MSKVTITERLVRLRTSKERSPEEGTDPDRILRSRKLGQPARVHPDAL